jgi:hypothetical protein
MHLKLLQHRKQMSLFMLLLSFLVGCQPHDEDYYRSHPQALFAALNTCGANGGRISNESCQRMKKMAESFQALALSLKQDPQVFGQKIIKLESKCASSSSQKEKNACHAALELRYAVVRWFESPEK